MSYGLGKGTQESRQSREVLWTIPDTIEVHGNKGFSQNPGGLTLSKGEMVCGTLESAAKLPGEGCSTHSCTIHSRDCMKGTWEKAALMVQEPSLKRIWMLELALCDLYIPPAACA